MTTSGARTRTFLTCVFSVCLLAGLATTTPAGVGDIQFITKKFCISGMSDGVNGWSFGFAFPGPPPVPAEASFNVPPQPPTAGPEELAQAFVDAVTNSAEFGVFAEIDPDDPGCFTITLLFESEEPLGEDHWDLAVGPQNLPPDCVVTAAGCPFNPTIFLLPPAVLGFVCDLCQDDEETISVCHVPPGNPDNAHTITIGMSALPAHLAHGDSVGSCGAGGTSQSAVETLRQPSLGHVELNIK